MTGIAQRLALSGVPFRDALARVLSPTAPDFVLAVRVLAFSMLGLAGVAPATAQGTAADYERARSLKATYEKAAGVVAEPATWIEKTSRFWYRRAVPGGHEFVVVDATTQQKQPAFDHARLASALSVATGRSYTGLTLPFARLVYTKDQHGLEVAVDATPWTCDLSSYTCTKGERRGEGSGFGNLPRDCQTLPNDKPLVSPDGRWEAVVQNFNLAIRPKPAAHGDGKAPPPGGTNAPALTWLSADGSDGNCYQSPSLAWSPDSTRLAAMRVRPGFRRIVHYVESSPEDQLQPKHSTRFYAKPGDALDVEQPVIFQIEPRRQLDIDRTLFPNAFELSPLVWRKDSRALTFEYNQRGHQIYRVIEVDAVSGRARSIVSEEPKTFFYYNQANGTLTGSGKRYRHDVADGREIVWMSERDGWNHLYLYDGAAASVKNQITKGEWVVRGVVKVDEEKRQIWFSAGGMKRDEDPYFAHYYRINFDGSGLTPLTTSAANHTAAFSTDMQYFVDTASRVDMAPVSELRRTSDGSLVMTVERGDLSALAAAGWRPPEVFVAPGRDGATPIYGVIFKPTTFDPAKRYPVLEGIYAGPQGSFVPKSFAAYSTLQAQAELGFIVVQIDGMGTSNRSKAFHDVAWMNLGDAGFPDRIAWHKALAAKYAWYDVSRVGLFGGSAGGQNALGGLLFHPEFYQAAVAYAGCHDNRMDKIWWNEQWMGWPLGPHYAASSNVDHAGRLTGKLLLVVGDMDTNVDPSSTMQVVKALLKANKDFDLLVVPGGEHNAGRGGEFGAYGERKRFDFFVRHLLGVSPPSWNDTAPPTTTETQTGGRE
jgi:dipeptidyl aminopeptidase/acylaminoacyl peptidase